MLDRLTSSLLWSFLALAPVCADAGSLSLRALDPQGAPIPRAVALLDTQDGRVRLQGVTDAAGRHTFTALSAGEYLVSASAPGFAGAGARRLTLAAGEDLELTLSLQLSPFQEHVVVTAAATPQTALELSKALTVVDARELDERDEHALGEALRRVPGVRVQQLGGPGSLTTIRVRGQRTEDTALLIDGVRFRDPAGTQGDASAFLSDMIATDLERIEVLRGSGSSLYGSHAIGGIVNVITDAGGGPTRGSLLGEGGSLGFYRGRGQASGGTRDGALAWSAGLARVEATTGLEGNAPSENTSGQARLQWRVAPSASLTARLYAADATTRLTESPQAIGSLPSSGIIEARPLADAERHRFEAGTPIGALALGDASFLPNPADPDSRRESRFVSALARFEHRPRPRLGWSVAYHGLWTERAFFDGPLGVSGFEPAAPSRSDFDGRIHTAQARLDLGIGARHLLTAGWELEQESLLNRTLTGDPVLDSAADVTQRSHAAFAQLQLELAGGALRLAASGRGQFFRLEAPVLTPREASPYRDATFVDPEAAWTGDVSAVWRPSAEGPRLRAHVGNGYRAPSLYERFGTAFGSFGYSVFGDPRLAPERSTSIDVGLDHAFADGAWQLSATLFQTELHEAIVFDFSGAISPDTDPFGRFGGYASAEGGGSRGLELSVSARPAPGLRLAASWTWSDSEAPGAGAPDADRAYVVPRHAVTLVATQEIGAAYVNLDVALSDSTLAPIFDPATFASRSYRFAGYARVDLGAGWRLRVADGRTLRLFGKIDDLLDRKPYENGFRTPGRTARAGAALEF